MLKKLPGSVTLAAVIPVWSTVPVEETAALADSKALGPVALHLVVVDDKVDQTACVVNLHASGDGWFSIWAWTDVAIRSWEGGVNGLDWRVASLDWSRSGYNTSEGGNGDEGAGETHFEGVWVVIVSVVAGKECCERRSKSRRTLVCSAKMRQKVVRLKEGGLWVIK